MGNCRSWQGGLKLDGGGGVRLERLKLRFISLFSSQLASFDRSSRVFNYEISSIVALVPGRQQLWREKTQYS